jgi:SsrA-binding protein
MSIIDNRKATHDFFIEDRYEAGIVLLGWEVKAIRGGRGGIKESHIVIRDGELFWLNGHITALPQASTHVVPEPTRTRKLLLNKAEIHKLIGKVERAGFTLVPLNLHYKGNRIKLELGLAKGKKLHDKRDADAERDWKREQSRLMKHGSRD